MSRCGPIGCLQLAQSLHVRRLERPEPPPPHVDRLLANLVLPCHFRDRASIGFAQNGDHLLFGKSNLLHQLLASLAGAIVSSYERSEKPGQVTGTCGLTVRPVIARKTAPVNDLAQHGG
jgi:hypothetical protein